MSSAFHLRPVSPTPQHHPGRTLLPSPSDSASAHMNSRDRSRMPSGSGSTARPMSPSQLRELDLTHDPEMARKLNYPAPPTGHDLMAMFPPAPPPIFPPSGPNTSGYFQSQERAFFAQAGKEIVRVRVEVDTPPQTRSHPHHQSSSHHHHSSSHSHMHPLDGEKPGPRSWAPSPPRRTGPVPVTPAPLFPHAHQQHAHHSHSAPPQNMKHEGSPPEEDSPDADEAWKRPMPYNERRRAGKHTRRVIVRN